MPEWKAAVILPIIYWMEDSRMWGRLYEHTPPGVLVYQSFKLASELYIEELTHYLDEGDELP